MLQQGGSATGVEGTAELYSLEGSGEPLFCRQENKTTTIAIAIEEKWPPFNTATGP